MSWVTSYAWECVPCDADSGITFSAESTAQAEAAKHAEQHGHWPNILAVHDEVHDWEPDPEDGAQ